MAVIVNEKFLDYEENTPKSLKIYTFDNGNDFAFSFAGSSIKKFRISKGVKFIPENAFRDCLNITSVGPVGSGADVEIPNSATTIKSNAFNGCTNLVQITLPKNIKSINDHAFANCTSLETINVTNTKIQIDSTAFENSSSNLYEEGNILYINTEAHALFDKDSTQSQYVVREGTTRINEDLFKQNKFVTNVSLPNTITTIDKSSFYECSNLVNINIPNNITTLNESTFSNCTSLTNITIPNSVTSIGRYAFGGCKGITSLMIPNSVTSIGNYAFAGTDFTSVGPVGSGANLQIPDSVNSIGEGVFQSCTSLTNAVLPDGIVGGIVGTFNGCTNLSYVEIGHGIQSMTRTFENCPSLDTLKFGRSVTSITDLFYNGYTSNDKLVTNVTYNSEVLRRGTDTDTHLEVTNITIGKYFPRISEINGGIFPILCKNMQRIFISNIYVDSENPYYSAIQYNSSLLATDENKLVLTKSQRTHSFYNETFAELGDGKASAYSYGTGRYFHYDMTLPNTLTKINAHALQGARLYELEIPSNVTEIGEYALSNGIEDGALTFRPLVPPTINDLTQLSGNYTIKVPCASFSAYRELLSDYYKRVEPLSETCLQVQWVDMYECCVNGEVHMKQKKQISNDGETWYDCYNNRDIVTRINETVIRPCETEFSVDLNDQWQTSTSYGNLSGESANYEFYESFSNKGVNSGLASMIITFKDYDTFTLKVRNYSESSYDYVVVNKLDDLTPPTWQPNASSVQYRNISKSSQTTWYDVQFTDLTAGEHKILITYGKDTSGNNGEDRGYVAIPNT